MARQLVVEEESFVGLLVRAGLRANAARCLAVLLRGGAPTRQELARAADLAPQDVSAAMRELEAAGAARVERVERAGPGRPPLRYRLSGGASEVLRALEASRRAAILAELEALDALRARADGL